MMGPLTIFPFRTFLAAGALLTLLGTMPARAATIPVYFDRADFGFGEGWGVSETTAQAANAAGIPIVTETTESWSPALLPVDHNLSEGSFNAGNPSTVQSNWSAINNTGILDENLYLVFARPTPNQFVTQHEDVGLVLSFAESGRADWVIVQVQLDPNAIPVYYPAVSLGTLGSGDAENFKLYYSLFDLQISQGTELDEVGLPQWNLAFFSTAAPIPEPSSGLLMLFGLVGIARARRKRS
jgi:hypothetical protein